MTRRTINAGIGMCTYTDVNGVTRIGVAGEEVDVHPADVARFNKVNGIITYEAPAKKAPAKKATPQTKPARKT
jgi:hypothetical protein